MENIHVAVISIGLLSFALGYAIALKYTMHTRLKKDANCNPKSPLTELTEKDLTCISMHMHSLFEQACAEQVASWGAPCIACKHAKKCQGEWLEVAGKIQHLTGITFQMHQG